MKSTRIANKAKRERSRILRSFARAQHYNGLDVRPGSFKHWSKTRFGWLHAGRHMGYSTAYRGSTR